MKAVRNGVYTFKLSWERCKKAGCIPKWVEDSQIEQTEILKIYIKAQQKALQQDEKQHVDHIIPISHPMVCGLHCKENLQILSKKVNQGKSNKFHPYRLTKGGKPVIIK